MKLRNSLLLLITATIWGTAFVAQSVGMDYVGPMTYVCARSIIGMIVLLPVIAVLNRVGPPRAAETPEERRKGRKTLVIGGVCCGTVLCIASCTQQFTLLHTTVGKAGFMTACYILVVPLLGLLFGRRCGLKHWCSVAIALAGLYFLCMTGGGFNLDLGTLRVPVLLPHSRHRLFFDQSGRRKNVLHPVFHLRGPRGHRHAAL